MIFVICDDDPKAVQDAYSKKYKQPTFGISYCYVRGHTYDSLRRDENLFIVSHGNPIEIGNRIGTDISFSPQQLAAYLRNNLIPDAYTGNIFVSACKSAPEFVSGLRDALGWNPPERNGVRNCVYGCYPEVEGLLEPPASGIWILAK